MYKVIVVDDDYPMLEFLSAVTPWERLGLQLAGTFQDGLAAWEAGQKIAPDIVIADIGMPGIDGLELIRRMKELNPSTRTVVISCHDEFEYARQALKLGVTEYLLKETLHPKDVEELLQRVTAELDAEQLAQQSAEELHLLVQQNHLWRKESFLRKTIEQPVLNVSNWLSEAESVGLEFRRHAYLPVLGFINRYADVMERYVHGDILTYAVEKMYVEHAEGIKNVESPRSDGSAAFRPELTPFYGKWHIFWFPIADPIVSNAYDEAEARVFDMHQLYLRYLKINMSFWMGTPCRNHQDVIDVFSRFRESETERFYEPEGSIRRRPPNRRPAGEAEQLTAAYPEALQQFKAAFLEQDAGKAEAVVNEWMQHAQEEHYPPEALKEWLLNLLFETQLQQRAMHPDSGRYTQDNMYRMLAGMDSLEHVRVWLTTSMREMISQSAAALSVTKRKEIRDAKLYIHRHAERKVTLEEVAGHLHLNASYFSRLFKREEGVTFVEYVTRVKIERAKAMLDEGARNVEEISAALGYEHKSYFTKLFRQVVGMTPREYRSR